LLSILGQLFPIMLNVVLPVFLLAAVGFGARKFLGIDPRPLTRVSIYVMLPALLFNSMLTATLGGDEIARIGIYTLVLTGILVSAGWIGSGLAGFSQAESSGFTLGSAFPNTANYGLPVVLFAFGQEGFERGAMFVVFTSIIQFSIGVYVAARGRMDWRAALAPVLKMPVLWAAVAGLTVRLVGLPLPLPVERSVSLLASGAIPLVILLLGMQVAGIQARVVRPSALAAVGVRLLVAPLIGLLLVALLQPSPLTAKILVLESAMPTAVNTTLLAAEFDAEPELVSSITLLTTLCSFVTVSGWVAYLQSI
jgi:malate permease and related proteins